MSNKNNNRKCDAMNLDQFNELFQEQTKDPRGVPRKLAEAELDSCVRRCRCSNLARYILSLVPILTWLPRYNWREQGVSDLVAGLTVAIMHIPQGMAYAMLAGVEPVTGIYTAIWPVLVYVILGNMPHPSFGTFAIVCLMSNQVIQNYDFVTSSNTTSSLSNMSESPISSSPDMISMTAVTLSCGIIQSLVGLTGLGSLTVVISDTIISSFTVGASIHVATSQIRHVLGIRKIAWLGPGRIIMTYIGHGRDITGTNLVTLSISIVCILALILSSSVLEVKAKNYCKYPLPSQLFLMLIMAVLSYVLELDTNYGVKTIGQYGDIPTGFPPPSTEHLFHVPGLILQSVPVAVVGTVISLGLGTMFGAKHGYKVPPNPECIAQGVSNIVGSFFSCVPMSASLSRSLVQEKSGCKSLITALVSCITLIAVVLSLAPIFKPLPVCVLAAIILSSLTGMFRKMKEVLKYWSRSRWDGVIWIVTFLSTVLVEVDLGLIIGVLFSFLVVIIRSVIPSVAVLQRDAKSRIWLDRDRFNVEGDKKFLIIQIRGPVNFLTTSFVKSLINIELGKSNRKGSWKRNSIHPSSNIIEVKIDEDTKVELTDYEDSKSEDEEDSFSEVKRRVSKVNIDDEHIKSDDELIPKIVNESPSLILDLSKVTWMDEGACKIITWLSKEETLCGLVVPQHLEETLESWSGFSKLKCIIYPSIEDAVKLAVD